MGYYFDLVFPPEVATQKEVVERLRRAGAGKFPPEPDPYYPEPGPEDLRMLMWRGPSNALHVLDIPFQPTVPRTVEAGSRNAEFWEALRSAWGRDLGWVSIRASWGEGPSMSKTMLDLLGLAELVGARLWDGQTRRIVTRETVAEAVRGYERIASAVCSLLGTVDRGKYRVELDKRRKGTCR